VAVAAQAACGARRGDPGGAGGVLSGLPTVAAKDLASALVAYAASNWRSEQRVAVLPDGASGRHRALHRVLRADKGAPLGWRRIAEILGTARNGSAVPRARDQTG
jgi:hypothetical protein